MKKGTNVGLDANFQNVKVGDTIRDKNGKFYEIDKYGHAVPNQGGNAVPLDELGEIHLVLTGIVTTDPKRVFTKEDAWLLLEDKDLAEELRRRGYEVKATKMIEL